MKNIGQPEFNDFEIVPGPVIDVNLIVDWCMARFSEYEVKKIAMDTYRYTLFKRAFEDRGISIEDRKNPNGIVRLIRKITSATGIIAPFIQSMFSQGDDKFWSIFDHEVVHKQHKCDRGQNWGIRCFGKNRAKN